MTKQRFPDYRSCPSDHDRSRRSSRPDPHDWREYDTRGYYDGGSGGGDRVFQPVKLSGLSAGFLMSESPSVKFQWNNLMDRKPDGHNPAANPGPRRPEFRFSNESDAYRLNSENGYGGGGGEIRVSDHHPGPDPAGRYGYSPHSFTSPPLPNSHVGAPKGEDFRVRDHSAYMGQADTTAFRARPGFRGISDEFSGSREVGPPPMAYGGYSQAQIPPLNEFVGTIDRSGAPSYGGQFRRGSSSTQEISQWNSYPSFVEQAQPSIASYQPLSQQQAVPTRGFGFGGHDGLERGHETVSFEGALRSNALVEGGLRADDMKTLKMCARRRKLAQRGRRRRRGNEPSDDSQSDLSDDDEDIGEYPALGGFEWNNHQVEGQWNIDQNAHLGDDPLSMNENVGFVEDQMSIGGIHQGGMYGGHQWNDLNNLNSENMLPSSSRPPAAMQEHSAEHFQSNRRDIKMRLQQPLKSPSGMKKRLGPGKSPDSIKRRLGPVKPPGSIMKRLGPAQDHVPNVKLLGSTSQDRYKSQIRGTDCFSGSIHAQRGGLPISKGKHAKEELPKAKPAKKELPKAKPTLDGLPMAKPAKKELPEDSVEFKKLVDSAFLKYIKALYDIPASLTTKCCVCASNSKEFAGTVALAKHAFMSPMGRFRAEHLGYHKALCVLLGWDSGVVENGTWVQRFLPDAEALALREDLFIWPPVVFIHNTSITNINPQERLIVSVEGLEAILKAIGFGGGKTKVCRGKSDNQSIMVVTFSATFSGLRDAERLHNLFADNKHGRPEFQQISSSRGDQSLQANNVNCLYGYLALAEDLDKFEAETKKRCVVRSKKEVQAIADASL